MTATGEFLARADPTDLAYGALAAWVWATPGLSVASGLAVPVGEQGKDWVAVTTTLSVAGVGGMLALLVWGMPVGLLLAYGMRRSPAPLHALAFVGFGAVSGLLGALLAGSLFGGQTMPAPGVSALIVGIAAGLGWAAARRRSTRGGRIRRRPHLPGPGAVALLGRPGVSDALTGAVFTWIIVSTALAVASPIVLAWGQPWTLWGVVLAPPLVLFFTAIVSGVVVLVVGLPAAFLLGRLLAPVRQWQIHLAAYAALGAALAGAFALLDGSLYEFSLFGAMTHGGGAVALMVVTSLSVAAGWAIAWRRAVLTERLRLALVAH